MGKKAGVALHKYPKDDSERDPNRPEQHEDPCPAIRFCCFRAYDWRNELYEALENETLFNTITALLVVDVLCILAEFVVHDPGLSENAAAHTAGFYISCTSLTILGVFQAENFTLMCCLQEQFFWHVGHIIDFIVIPASIILETQIPADVGGLMVILRFWRLVRVAHGVWEGNQKTKDEAEEEAASLVVQKALAEAKKDLEEHGHDAHAAAKKKFIDDHHFEDAEDQHAIAGDHFKVVEEDGDLHNIDPEDKSTWTEEMKEQFAELTEHLEETEEEKMLRESGIMPIYRLEMHEVLDQEFVHNLISALLVCDVIIVVLEFVVHDPGWHEDAVHDMHVAGYYLTCASLTILGCFQFEAFMNMNATGRFLFEFYGHFLDCIIIPLSITLEFAIDQSIASLLILLRLWRLVRIMHGVFTADEEKSEGNLLKREKYIEDSLRQAHHIVVKTRALSVASQKAQESGRKARGTAGGDTDVPADV